MAFGGPHLIRRGGPYSLTSFPSALYAYKLRKLLDGGPSWVGTLDCVGGGR